MNPWNIDVAELAEKYLKKINELQSTNLRIPANAILACAILLKTKSKYLRLSSLEEEEEKEEMSPEQKNLLLEELPDLMANRSAREGRITLDELVLSIEDLIHRNNPKKNPARLMPRMEINFDTTSIEERIEDVFNTIKEKADSQGIVLFRNLLAEGDTDTIVNTFLPVLFLMNKGKVLAYQNEFFSEIFIQMLVTTLAEGN
jgi:segregation and condensation protein A